MSIFFNDFMSLFCKSVFWYSVVHRDQSIVINLWLIQRHVTLDTPAGAALYLPGKSICFERSPYARYYILCVGRYYLALSSWSHAMHCSFRQPLLLSLAATFLPPTAIHTSQVTRQGKIRNTYIHLFLPCQASPNLQFWFSKSDSLIHWVAALHIHNFTSKPSPTRQSQHFPTLLSQIVKNQSRAFRQLAGWLLSITDQNIKHFLPQKQNVHSILPPLHVRRLQKRRLPAVRKA